MRDEDFRRIEQAIGIKLPGDYRPVVERRARDLRHHEEVDGGFTCDPAWLIDKNLYFRDVGFRGESWPGHYFLIGDSPSGSLFYLDLQAVPPAVFEWCNETGERTLRATSIEGWALERIHIAQTSRAEELKRSRAARLISAPKWWQFWRR